MSRMTLLLCLCGLICSQVSAGVVSEALVGSDHAKKGEFKYVISLQFDGKIHCGGSIITDHYILTAAHCVADQFGHVSFKPYRVIAGTHNLNEKKHAIIVAVDTIYIHREYQPKTLENDIAILKLVGKGVDLRAHSHKIDRINLTKGDSNFAGVSAVVAGFGLNNMNVRMNSAGYLEEMGGSFDGKLRYGKVKVLSHKGCVELNKPQLIFKTHICGQMQQRKHHHYEGVCAHDSGSPLVYGNELIGLVSKSPFACDESKKAATYTRISSYLPLIHGVIGGKPGHDVVTVRMSHG